MRLRVSVTCLLMIGIAGPLTGCKDSASSSNSGDQTFRVAIVVPGSTADQGWNYSAKEAAVRLEKELKLDGPVTFIENLESSKRKSALRDLGREKYDLVICHGYEFHQTVKEIASDFKETTFVISGYDQPNPHFGSIVYQLGEAAYLCGVVASQVTESGRVGFIAAMPVPPVVLCYEGFRNGFLAHRQDGMVSEPVYIEGSRPWEDSSAAKAKTQALLGLNDPAPIDVLFQNADAASRGIFEAVQERDSRIFVFGANRNQNDSPATSKVLASAVIHVDEAFLHVAQAVREGTYQPHVASETVATGVIDCVLHSKLDTMIGKDQGKNVRTLIEQVRQQLIEGKIVPYASR